MQPTRVFLETLTNTAIGNNNNIIRRAFESCFRLILHLILFLR